MAATNAINLPTEEELTVPEINLSGVVLRAASLHLGSYCENYNNEFMLCRKEYENDPRMCLTEGKAVTNCTMEFFREVKNSCAEEFKKFYKCLDRSSANYNYTPCKNTQQQFDLCMQNHVNLSRPPFGYFTRARIHRTDRPKPTEEPLVFDTSDLPRKLTDDKFPDRPEAKYGLRYQFVT